MKTLRNSSSPIKYVLILVVLCLISYDILPLVSILTLGSGNLWQLIFVFALIWLTTFVVVLFKNSLRFKSFFFLLFLLCFVELLLSFANDASSYIAARLLLSLSGIVLLALTEFGYDDFKRVVIVYLSALVTLSSFVIFLGSIYDGSIFGSPSSLADEAIFRKLDYAGDLKISSFLFVNMLHYENPDCLITCLYSSNLMYAGFSSEPHAFFSLCFVAFIFLFQKRKEINRYAFFLLFFLFGLNLIYTFSWANMLAIFLALAILPVMTTSRKYIVRSVFLTGLIGGIVAFSVIEIPGYAQLIDRSAFQSFLSLERLFTFEYSAGILTYGPSFGNSYDVDNIFLLNLSLFWVFLYFMLMNVNENFRRRELSKLDVFIFLYLFVYSFKNVSGTFFMVYIILIFYFSCSPNRYIYRSREVQ